MADGTKVRNLMVVLKPTDLAGMKALARAQTDRSSASFHKFLTPAQFKQRFGRSDAEIALLTLQLKMQGLTFDKVYGNNLVIAAHATNTQLNKTFSTQIHNYTKVGVLSSFQAPATAPVIPAAMSALVAHVAGLSSEAPFHSYLAKGTMPAGEPGGLVRTAATTPAAMPTSGIAGQYSVTDLAKWANVTPLYTAGFDGTGQTIGIITFASFNTADAGAYWAGVGGNINSDTSRITVTNVSAPAVIGTDGDDETTLDVEQSGGMAPKANIIVYEATNDDTGELAAYTQAATDNKADVVSISWGLPEVFKDPDQANSIDYMVLELAIQGTPVIAASGDAGAYDMNGDVPYPTFSPVLAVDYPASSPYVLGAGGLTLPFTYPGKHGPTVIPQVRPWATDYLQNYILKYYGQSYYFTNIFSEGGGGGVSVNYDVPFYQQGLPGLRNSAAGQSVICMQNTTNQPCTPGDDYADLPANYAGRNVPDLSLDADPSTGYTLYYLSAWYTGGGGTSFVAPQLNGIFTVITQMAGQRMGWLNPTLYSLFQTSGYNTGSPFVAITSGDNWAYPAGATYNPASGLGAIDANAMANAIKAYLPAPSN